MYQIYFRIRRGGTGIPYELAKTEFMAVFNRYGLCIKREHADRRRMWIDLDLAPERVKALACDLGYTEAILRLHKEPYCGERITPVERGRWYTGWIRQREWKVHQTEAYVQHATMLLAESPDRRPFQVAHGEKAHPATGRDRQRALSALDARFLFNISGFSAAMKILDPFAGFGGIVMEGRRRGISVFAADIDARLSPGLCSLSSKRHFVGDARAAPIHTASLDGVITEPPFRSCYRQAVMESLPELRRVLKPAGRIVLLIAADMREAVSVFFERLGGCVKTVQIIPRDSGLKCPVLTISFSKG